MVRITKSSRKFLNVFMIKAAVNMKNRVLLLEIRHTVFLQVLGC